ncbi:MAG: HD domain-containing phosphohydrolase [Solirubrobacteraceae bacterium]
MAAGLVAVGTAGSVVEARAVADAHAAGSRHSLAAAAAQLASGVALAIQRESDLTMSASAFVAQNPGVSQAQFASWVASQQAHERYPELSGIGFSVIVPRSRLRVFEQRAVAPIRPAGAGAFTVVPAGNRPFYCLTATGVSWGAAYTAASAWIDECALPGAGQALLAARDSGAVSYLAGPYQGHNVLAVLAPVYRGGVLPPSVAGRRRAFVGWVAQTLVPSVMLARAVRAHPGMALTVSYSSGAYRAAFSSGHATVGAAHMTLGLAGGWTARVSGPLASANVLEDSGALGLLGGGTIVSLLLGVLVYVLASGRARALWTVAQKTSELEYLAMHDALTGLPNRRALISDLRARLADAAADRELMLALFDLDGFKEYNDTFGHPAGDALLARLGERLARAVDGIASAYRMGGDEFCVLAPASEHGVAALAARAASALSETGESFNIGCSYGIAQLPRDACSPPDALQVADDRMYEHKGARVSAGRQSTDVLLRALAERSPELTVHLSAVATLATATAKRLGLSDPEIKLIGIAAELHDVGKVAIPDSILNKPGPLDEHEWQFMRRHTEIGERIINAAPSLAHAAPLVRSSHERHDGAGYPDQLAGEQIPLGASIIAVCDAFNAMTSQRPYSEPITPDQALDELRRCSAAQFHPHVVQAFCDMISTDTEVRDSGVTVDRDLVSGNHRTRYTGD